MASRRAAADLSLRAVRSYLKYPSSGSRGVKQCPLGILRRINCAELKLALRKLELVERPDEKERERAPGLNGPRMSVHADAGLSPPSAFIDPLVRRTEPD